MMFKNTWELSDTRLPRFTPFPLWMRQFVMNLLGVVVPVILLCGCQTGPLLGPVNPAEGTWVIREGQAIWTPPGKEVELAGELLVASSGEDRALAQFTKNPFPVVSAQRTRDSWQLEIPAQNRVYRHRGDPPGRILWFVLVDATLGKCVREPWAWRTETNGNWVLENSQTGERLEGFFDR